MPIPYKVELADGDDAYGISNIVAILLEQNVQNYSDRVQICRRMPRPVAILNTDTDLACTISFGVKGATVYNDVVGKPSVLVKATVDQITDVSQLKMVGSGLIPIGFFTKRGFRVLFEIAKHKLVVKGLILHPITALQLIGILSIAP